MRNYQVSDVAFHRAATVNELIISHGHNPLFLPPYSPFLNPIGNMFNQWKHWIKSGRSEKKISSMQIFILLRDQSLLSIVLTTFAI